MQEVLNVFSARELSLIIWIIIIVTAMTFSAKLRQSMLDVLQSIFATKIGGILLAMIAYVGLIIWGLAALRLFNNSLLKDLVFWFFSFAIVSFFTVNKANSNNYFKEILKDCFKWTLFVEFLVNFYTFSFITELILFPLLGFIILLHAYAKTDRKQEPVSKLLNSVLVIIGWGYFLYVLYKTVTDYQALLHYSTLYSFVFPIVLTISLLPFLYLLAVYMSYEMLFLRLRWKAYGEEKTKKLKWAVIKIAKFNLTKINLIDKGLDKSGLYEADDIEAYLRTLIVKGDSNK